MKKITQNAKEKNNPMETKIAKPAVQQAKTLLLGLDNVSMVAEEVRKAPPTKSDLWSVNQVMGGLTNLMTMPVKPSPSSVAAPKPATSAKAAPIPKVAPVKMEAKVAKKQEKASKKASDTTQSSDPDKQEEPKGMPKKVLRETVLTILADGAPRTVSEIEQAILNGGGKVQKISLYNLFKEESLFRKHADASPAKFSLISASSGQVTDSVTQVSSQVTDSVT